jgi:hypothetical protein
MGLPWRYPSKGTLRGIRFSPHIRMQSGSTGNCTICTGRHVRIGADPVAREDLP